MQDPTPGGRKRSDETYPEGAPASVRNRRRRELLNEQLRAIYQSYASSEIPPKLLDLAARFEQEARRHLSAGASPAAPARDRDEDA